MNCVKLNLDDLLNKKLCVVKSGRVITRRQLTFLSGRYSKSTYLY